MYTLKVKSHFDAAHFLPWHEGKCKNLHGHRWEVEAVIETDYLDENYIVIDFSIVKDMLRRVLPDHTCLNDKYKNPTAEQLAFGLYHDIVREIIRDFFGGSLRLAEVTVWESPDCSVTYRPEE